MVNIWRDGDAIKSSIPELYPWPLISVFVHVDMGSEDSMVPEISLCQGYAGGGGELWSVLMNYHLEPTQQF